MFIMRGKKYYCKIIEKERNRMSILSTMFIWILVFAALGNLIIYIAFCFIDFKAYKKTQGPIDQNFIKELESNHKKIFG